MSLIICQHKIDLLAITEIWLNTNDDAVRTERTGGGTALLHRDSLQVKKITAGGKKST